MSITIQLMDERTLGRNFQVATLGCIYCEASNDLKKALEDGLATGFIRLDQKQCEEMLSLISAHLDKIAGEERRKTMYPKLYGAGAHDPKILKGAGLIESNVLNASELKRTSANLTCQKLMDSVSTPMLLRHYVFSKYRSGDEVEKISIGSLWLAVVGAITSLVAVLNINDQRTEIYLVPDGTRSSMINSCSFYNLIYSRSQSVERRFGQVLNDLTKEELSGVSVDQALSLAVMIHAVQDLDLISRLVTCRVFEQFLIVKTIAEKRPQLVYATPIIISSQLEQLINELGAQTSQNFLRGLDNLVVNTLRLGRVSEGLKNASIAASTSCLNSLFRYLETGDNSTLLECAGNLARLHSASVEANVRDLAEQAKWLLIYLSMLIKPRRVGQD
ncbi:MAG: hypothetical protein QW196_01650 [Sulfolobales archaeon]